MAKPSPLTQIPDDALAEQDQRNFMMNNTYGWMGGWMSGGMWLWTAIGVAVVVLLLVVMSRYPKK
jgi:uncharacterized membrane protein